MSSSCRAVGVPIGISGGIMSRNRRTVKSMIAVALVAVAAVGCSNREEGSDATNAPTSDAPSTEAPTSEAPTTEAPAGEMFGDMASPCGPATDAGVPTIADGQNGGDTLKLGTATDHGYEAAPGLTVEMLDAAEAFAGWCNEQGGIRGLPIEIVDLDGKLFNVPAATEQACAETFAMVGGGWVFDNQMYPRFHECGMVSFPGYAVTAEASLANGRVQPIPNPPNLKPASWFLWAKQYQAEAIGKPAIIYGDFVSTKMVAEQIKATLAAIGGFGEPLMIPTNPAGEANWTPFAQQLKNEGITMLSVVGEPGNMILLYKAMRERKSGVIVNIIGVAGERHRANYITGTTGNAGLMAFTRALGSESVDHGIRVVGINPGRIETERQIGHFKEQALKAFGDESRWPELQAKVVASLPFGRAGRPSEVSDLATFLASNRASYISGTVVTIDAGSSLRPRV